MQARLSLVSDGARLASRGRELFHSVGATAEKAVLPGPASQMGQSEQVPPQQNAAQQRLTLQGLHCLWTGAHSCHPAYCSCCFEQFQTHCRVFYPASLIKRTLFSSFLNQYRKRTLAEYISTAGRVEQSNGEGEGTQRDKRGEHE